MISHLISVPLSLGNLKAVRARQSSYNLNSSNMIDDSLAPFSSCAATRGGGTPLYKVYRYVPTQSVWFLSRFGLKTGIDFE